MRLHLSLDLKGGEELREALLGRLVTLVQAVNAELDEADNDNDAPAEVTALADIASAVKSAPLLPDGFTISTGFGAKPGEGLTCDASTVGSIGAWMLAQARDAGAEGDVARVTMTFHFANPGDAPNTGEVRSLTATCNLQESDDDLPYA